MSPKLKKIARILFITINLVVILFYLMACLVPFLDGGKHWVIAIMGLVFPLLFFALLAFLIYWLTRRSKWSLICIAALLLGWQQFSVAFNLFAIKRFNAAKAPENLRILTWNLSSWGESNRSNKKDNMDSMVSVIKNVNADVLCFQEYVYAKDKMYRDSIIPSLKENGYQYAYFAKVRYGGYLYQTTILTAVVVMSKYPIIDSAKFYYSADKFEEPLVYADIKINDQTIRFFSTHLRPVSFKSDDYETLHNLKEPVNASVAKSRLVLWKLRLAYKERTTQAELLHNQIKESPHPVIVCGDFNDVPNSYTYFKVKGNLQDAFLKKGWGFGRTLRFISPTLRIDYILADKQFDVKQYTELKFPYSDHYPVVADIDIRKGK